MKNNGSLLPQISKVLMIVFLTASTIFSQTTYYISNSQGNDSNIGTTESTAWKSLDKLNSSWNLVQPGDSVLLKRGDSWSPSSVSNLGVIELPNNKSGTAGNYIVIGAYGSGAKPFINSTNITNYHNIIRTGSTAYLIIQDINFKTIRSVIIRPQDNWDVGVHHLKFLRCDFDFGFVQGVGGQGHFEIYNPYTPQNPQPNITAPQHHIEIGYCTFTNTGGEDCLQIERPSVITGNDPNWKDHNGTDVNHWIHNNIFKMVREEAMDIGGGNNHLIEYNFVSGTGANGMKFHSQVREFTNSTIRGNVMVHAGMGDLLQDTGEKMSGGAAIVFQNVSNCAIYNNVAYSRWSFWYGDRDRTGTLGYFGTFENNTIYNNISYGCVLIEGVVNNVINNIGLTNTFSNNTYYGPDDSGDWEPNKVIRINGDYITMGTFSSSWVEGTGNGGTNENNSKPLFENDYWTTPYVYGDFSLGASSPMIDAGVNINGYTIDIEGNPVPQGSSTDRGAYEFNGVDLTAPRLISAEILNLNTVDVQFSESIKKSSAENVNNYSINNGITINSAVLSSSNKKVTLSTSSHSNGSYTVTAENIEDLSGNVIATNNSAQYSFISDLTPPEVLSAAILNPTKVEIIFSEAILEIDVQNISNYSINNGITVSEAEVETPTKVILTTSEHTSGNYTVTVNNIKDLAGNIISSSNNTASYSVQVDTILPDLISVEVLSPTSIKVIYSEKVQKSGAENISNYSIDNGIIIVSSLLSPSEKEVILSTSEHAGGSYTITVNNILDLAGNMIQPNSTKQYNVEEDSVSPELTSISLVDKNTLEVFFSEPINETDAENISNYIIESGITINSANLANSTKVTLTTSTHAVGEYTIMVSNIHDISGNVITSNNSLSYSYFPESPKPELLYAFAPQNNLVEVVFSKPVSQATAEDIQNYSISDNINVINAILKNSGEEVSLEVSELTADFHYTLTVENIQDLQGNTISPDSNSTVFCYLNNPGPIALYDFTEGMNSNIVYDISCNGAPLHLTISNLSAITWLEGGGMSVNSNVIISSDIAAKLNNNCKQTNALTIEAWIKPANSTQNGPARIVSLSNDRSNRNFTLGQGEGSNNTYGYDVRLRTSATSNNGVPSVTATSPAITTNLTHVVYTRSSEGETKIYIDGLESFSTTFNGNLSNWDNSFKLILANEMTGDRPWLGSFYKVAIYDKALDSDEVQTTFTEFNNTMLTNLRVFLEGPYNSGNMSTNLLDDQVIPLDQPYSAEPWNYDGYERVAEIPNDIVDWVLVEVRSDDTTIVAKRAAFLRKDGKVVDLNGISNVAFKDLASDEYYISIIHRNHLSILSADKVNIGNHSQLLDMTKAENVFGSESVSDLGNGVFGMYAGDTNCSSIITYADAMGIVQKNTKSGYNIADVNLSGIVTYADVTHVVNNNTKSANFKVNK